MRLGRFSAHHLGQGYPQEGQAGAPAVTGGLVSRSWGTGFGYRALGDRVTAEAARHGEGRLSGGGLVSTNSGHPQTGCSS